MPHEVFILGNLLFWGALNLLMAGFAIPTFMTLATLGMDGQPVSRWRRGLRLLLTYLVYSYPLIWILSAILAVGLWWQAAPTLAIGASCLLPALHWAAFALGLWAFTRV